MNCEEYVVRKLSEAETEIKRLNELNDRLNSKLVDKIIDFNTLVSILEKIGLVMENENGPWLVMFDTVFESSDYETMCKLLEYVPNMRHV